MRGLVYPSRSKDASRTLAGDVSPLAMAARDEGWTPRRLMRLLASHGINVAPGVLYQWWRGEYRPMRRAVRSILATALRRPEWELFPEPLHGNESKFYPGHEQRIAAHACRVSERRDITNNP